jgi:hypothetical protein
MLERCQSLCRRRCKFIFIVQLCRVSALMSKYRIWNSLRFEEPHDRQQICGRASLLGIRSNDNYHAVTTELDPQFCRRRSPEFRFRGFLLLGFYETCQGTRRLSFVPLIFFIFTTKKEHLLLLPKTVKNRLQYLNIIGYRMFLNVGRYRLERYSLSNAIQLAIQHAFAKSMQYPT